MSPGSGSTEIFVGLTPESEALIERRKGRVMILRREMAGAMTQGLKETESLLKTFLVGGDPFAHRDGQLPLANRSGALAGSITSELDKPPYSGTVGSGKGSASRYAGVQLSDKTWTIKPVNHAHLWIPTKENMTPGGVMKMSPSEAMAQTDEHGKRLLRIFYTKDRGLIAFMPESKGGNYTKGKNKGKERGKALFNLVTEVTVKGSGALIKAVNQMRPRFGELIQGAADRSAAGGTA